MRQPQWFTKIVRELCENNREWMIAEGLMSEDCVLTAAGRKFWWENVRCAPREAAWLLEARKR